MSVVDDSRKLLQDLITPELRAIDARLTALEKRFDEATARTERRFDEAQARTDKRFDEMHKHLDQRFDQVMSEIRKLSDIHDLQIRMTRLEGLNRPPQPSSSTSEAA
jgi:hypothetical protein